MSGPNTWAIASFKDKDSNLCALTFQTIAKGDRLGEDSDWEVRTGLICPPWGRKRACNRNNRTTALSLPLAGDGGKSPASILFRLFGMYVTQ